MYIRFCGAKIQIASETDVSLAEKNVSNLEKMQKRPFYGTFFINMFLFHEDSSPGNDVDAAGQVVVCCFHEAVRTMCILCYFGVSEFVQQK